MTTKAKNQYKKKRLSGYLNNVDLNLENLIYVNYRVPVKKLPVTLPPWLELFRTTDDPEQTIVSAVIYQSKVKKVFTWLDFVQNNYRAYVRNKITGEFGIWFFKMYLSTLWYPLPKMFSLPVGLKQMDLIKMGYAVEWSQTSLKKQMQTGFARIRYTGRSEKYYSGFEDFLHQKKVITYPYKAYFLKNDGRICEISLDHDEFESYEGAIEAARFPWFELYSLTDFASEENVHSCIYIPEAKFRLYRPVVYPFLRDN